MTSRKENNEFLIEEVAFDDVNASDEDDDDYDEDSEVHELDTQIEKSAFKDIISEEMADKLYDTAGHEESEENNAMRVYPSPHMLTTNEEQMIYQAKVDLSIPHDLDCFQVQALVALLNRKNVILTAPCGSGKLLVFQLGVYLMRQKLNLANGVGICLEPLNNILCEKTNNNPPLKTAYLTMTGDAVKEGNASLSHSLDDICSGEISCILGHAESFLSVKGIFCLFCAERPKTDLTINIITIFNYHMYSYSRLNNG